MTLPPASEFTEPRSPAGHCPRSQPQAHRARAEVGRAKADQVREVLAEVGRAKVDQAREVLAEADRAKADQEKAVRGEAGAG